MEARKCPSLASNTHTHTYTNLLFVTHLFLFCKKLIPYICLCAYIWFRASELLPASHFSTSHTTGNVAFLSCALESVNTCGHFDFDLIYSNQRTTVAKLRIPKSFCTFRKKGREFAVLRGLSIHLILQICPWYERLVQ